MDSYPGRINDPVTLHKYLYANANPVMNTDPTGYFSMADFSVSNAIQSVLNSMTSGVSLKGIMSLLNVVCTVYDVSQAVWQVINGEGSIMDIMIAVAKGAVTGYVLGFICKSPLKYVIRPLFTIFGIGGV